MTLVRVVPEKNISNVMDPCITPPISNHFFKKMIGVVSVAVGVIINSERNKILISQRPAHKAHGGMWEFPGGKVEKGELIYDALCRELKEELSLEIKSAMPFMEVFHDYNQYSVCLNVWCVKAFEGTPKGQEGQVVKWATFDELQQLSFPAANARIISALNGLQSVTAD